MRILINLWKPALGIMVVLGIKRLLGNLGTFQVICFRVAIGSLIAIALTYIIEWLLIRNIGK